MKIDKGKKKILEAAMELLLQKDISKITTRKVVNRAGVNIALLHYHFKTKNDLFSEAILVSTEKFFSQWKADNINLINAKREDLEKYVGAIIESVSRYPTVSRSKIYLFLHGVDEQLLSFGLIEDLTQIISFLLPDLSDKVVRQKLHFLGQLLISLRVSTSQISDGTGLDFEIRDDRECYTKLLLSQIFPELYQG